MNVQHATAAVTESHERYSTARLQGRWLLLGRGVWLMLVVLTLAVFFVLFPGYVALEAGQVPQALPFSGVSFAVTITLTIVSMLMCFAVASVIFWRKSNDWMALLVALMLVMGGTTYVTNSLQQSLSPERAPALILSNITFVVFFLVFCLFPNGRFVPRWIGWLPIVWVTWSTIFPVLYLFYGVPFSIHELVWYCALLFVVVVQMYRYRHVSSSRQRQQTKWVVFGVAIAILVDLGTALLLQVFPLLGQSGFGSHLLNVVGYTFALLLGSLSFAIAILRSRLYDIDIIINRTLVYGTLTASVVGIYALVVGGLGALLQARGNLSLSLLATGLIAVLIQPLHTRLQRAVNRLLYGERDDPYKVISRLGQRLEATLAPEAVLPTIVESVTQALRLPYAAISLKQDGEDVITASSGRASDELTRLPLVYQSEHIGDLLLAPRARGEPFSSADQTLLADLARQAGIAVHTVRLTTDLQRLTKELQHSRTHLVTTREEERRRLRRDLHDGLGSVLASLNWRAGALRMVLARDPVAADALVVEQQNTIQAAIGDIRRLVYDLRPPALDELGLIGAIRERAAKQSAPTERDIVLGLRVDMVAPDHLPALPAAVEVAAYRIVQEALANVVRHAQAHRCCICLSCENDLLQVEVTDDGIGLPESYRAGVGLLSLRERAAELGGTCKIAPIPDGGTRVLACLPLLKHDQQM